MEERQKPGILIIAKRWSGSCRDLGISLSGSTEMIQLAEQFVMMLALDDEEPEDEKFLPGNPFIIIRIIW